MAIRDRQKVRMLHNYRILDLGRFALGSWNIRGVVLARRPPESKISEMRGENWSYRDANLVGYRISLSYMAI
jgi:hypothetical protein